MFKLDSQEFIKYRVDFQKRLTDIADEIVCEHVPAGADLSEIDKHDLFDECFDMIAQEADRECIYTADCYKVVQFFQQWDSCEIDDAEQTIEDRGGFFGVKTLDDMHIQIAYTLWENHLVAAVQLRIDDLLAEEAA